MSESTYTPYANAGGSSNVVGTETTEDSIVVTFKDGARYLYNESSPGKADVEQMKRLAAAGSGLNSYISRTVRKRYASKLS